MPVESTATGIWDIDFNYPDGTTEAVSLLDNYMRVRWEKLLVTFPNIGGVVTASHTELNYVDGVTSAIQTQLDAKLASSTYTAADVLTKVKSVDGTGSGLDADLLDGAEGAAYAKLASADFTILQVGGESVATADSVPTSSDWFDASEIGGAWPGIGTYAKITAHGLGVAPDLVLLRFYCISDDNGYAAGETLMVNAMQGYQAVLTVYSDETNIYPKLNQSFTAVNRDNTANFNIRSNNWKLQAKVVKF